MLATVRTASGCACGCDVFDVGTSAMLPNGPGAMIWVDYDFQDQNQNRSGTSTAPASHNDDKDLETHFTDVTIQYLFNSSWGVELQVPYDFRKFTGTTDAGRIVTDRWSQFGDVRLEGLYTGFSPDLSIGVNLGVKLPTGDYKFDPRLVDRDTQLGTGSTDILMGGFYRHHLNLRAGLFWFAQTELDLPVLTQDHYRPGLELDSAIGLYSRGWKVGDAKLVPVAQAIMSERTSDGGAASAHPVGSGFQRILLSPGIEVDVHKLKFYADAEIPVYQNFVGNQLAAPVLIKATIAYAF
ncbi:MAG: transporter [Chthoniobacterales bacterium]